MPHDYSEGGMSIVQRISSQIVALMAEVLDKKFRPLKYVYEIEKNSKRSKEKGFGVIPLGVETTDGMSRHYTVEQGFELVIMDRYEDRNDESQKKAAVFNLFSKAEEIVDRIYQRGIGISEVIHVASFSIADPEVLEAEAAVVLRVEIRLQWRKRI